MARNDFGQTEDFKFETTRQEFFSTYPNKDWSIVDKMSHMQRRIIIHSIIYYHLNRNIITDYYYDKYCRDLLKLQQQATKEECEKTKYWYAFYDFDATTGCHLYSRLTDDDKTYLSGLATIAAYIHEKHETDAETSGKSREEFANQNITELDSRIRKG